MCGHCQQKLSEKSLKEHERLYLQDGVWLTETKIECGYASSEDLSEPFSISDPPEPDEEASEPLVMSSEEMPLTAIK